MSRQAEVEQELKDLQVLNRKLSSAYLRLRAKIPGAFDTPLAPTPEQIWETTEKSLDKMVERIHQLEMIERLFKSLNTILRDVRKLITGPQWTAWDKAAHPEMYPKSVAPSLVHVTPNREKCEDGQDHKWDGPPVEFQGLEGEGTSSASTCSKCGMDAMSWSLRYAE